MLVDPSHWRCSDNKDLGSTLPIVDLGRYITYSYLKILTVHFLWFVCRDVVTSVKPLLWSKLDSSFEWKIFFPMLEIEPWVEPLKRAFDHSSIQLPKTIFLKWANLGLFFVYFWSFQTTNTIFTIINVKKCSSSIRRRDLNPQLLKHELSPITTWPGHPPTQNNLCGSLDRVVIVGDSKCRDCVFESQSDELFFTICCKIVLLLKKTEAEDVPLKKNCFLNMEV